LDTDSIIQELYQNQRVNYLIKIKAPKGLQDDFKQEVFVALLELERDKVKELYKNDGLFWYLSRIILNLSTKTSPLYKKYRDIPSGIICDFIRSNLPQGYNTTALSTPANRLLSGKEQGTAEDWHEVQIFKMYVTERSCEKVAAYFGLPNYHIKRVVSKVKKELVKTIKDAN
jgi:hypothetical protein